MNHTAMVSRSPDKVWAEIQTCIVKVVPSLADAPPSRDIVFEDMGLSSIEMITIVFEIEEMYEIVIVDAGLDVFETGEELLDLVMRLTAEKEDA